LEKWKTGALRRPERDSPFRDLIESSPARGIERQVAPHPSLKPQAFVRQVVWAALPLGEGVIVDPFMGSGSTIAAATHFGYRSIGIEINREFYLLARRAIPILAAMAGNGS
jgi:site-specific DNA-methyltransferase (adenine-specific)